VLSIFSAMRLTPDRSRRLPHLTDRYELGDAGLRVSPFCLGLVGAPETIGAAYDAGINFFFLTADMHWPMYRATREGLRLLFQRGGGIRDDVVVGVVSYVAQPEFCYFPYLEVLDEVPGLERVDLTIIGGAYAAEFPTRRTVYTQRPLGQIPGARALGCTFHERSASVAALNDGTLDIGFVRYNAIHRGAEVDVFPHLSPDRRSLCYNFKSTSGNGTNADFAGLGLGADYWQPHVTDAYRYVLRHPEVDGLLCALPTARAVSDLARAIARGPLDEDEIEYMSDLGHLLAKRAKLNVTPPTDVGPELRGAQRG
jgi:hypothetical protein